MKKIAMACTLATLPLLATERDVAAELDQLKKEMARLKAEQSAQGSSLIEEIVGLKTMVYGGGESLESYSSMGAAASKVYHSAGEVSIGGYGEYELKKYTRFKNYAGDAANDTRKKTEWNIVRFVPYIGFKFNDWIVMNTEIEFEDGGARSDDTKNYKYAIVEFSYLDFLLDEKVNLRVGHVLVPFGLVNLNHEPVAYLTAERPTVETLIIPSTWHTNGALLHGKLDDLEYYAGLVTSPDAGGFIQGRYIQQGRLGARQFTDDLSFVGRAATVLENGVAVGGSLLYGNSTVAEETKPGSSTGNASGPEVTITMAEAHGVYKAGGWNLQALAVFGALGGNAADLPGSDENGEIPTSVNGQYVTAGYDLFQHVEGQTGELLLVGEVERLDLDASGDAQYPENHRFLEYTAGLAYYPDPKVSVKADYWIRDYDPKATLADESAFTVQLGFIF